MPSPTPSPLPIYLDNAATTRPLESVVEAMAGAHLEAFGNPSSAHDFARAPRQLLDDARDFLRGTLNAARVVFTSGGTEADLLGVVGAVAHRSPGRVLCAATDHPAILSLNESLQRSRHQLVPLPTSEDGDVDPELFFDHLGKDVRGVVILYGHNELGTLCELAELVALTRRVAPNAHIHVDLVQTYGKLPFDMDTAGVDSVAVSAHKLHGPRGIGFLALSSTAELRPLQAGGGQEGGLRGGTENVAGAVGLALAAETAHTHLATTTRHTQALADRLFDHISTTFPAARRLGRPDHRLPHILSVQIPGVIAHTLLDRMNDHGVAFSTGAACHGPQTSDNHVLAAIGLSRREAREVARFSFSRFNTPAEIDRVAALLVTEVEALLAQSPQSPQPRARGNPKDRIRQR